MSRIRSIKPEFCVSEQLAECSTNARLVFVLMWIFCDDHGIHPAKVRTLKGELFPLDEKITSAHVKGWVDELIAHGLLREYQIESEPYWIVTGWSKHQKIDKPSYKYPLPLDDDSPSPPRILADASPPERSREESKGVEQRRASRLPADWRASTQQIEWALEKRKDWDAEHALLVAERFRNHWLAKPGKDGTKLDWDATWRNWVIGERSTPPRKPESNLGTWV